MRCPNCGGKVESHWNVCPLCQTELQSASRDLRVTDAPAPVTDALADCYENSWAVVVGINSYRHVARLEYAVADAEAVSQSLASLGFAPERIIHLIEQDATLQNIQDVLSVDIARQTGPNDRVLVFFACHGQDFPTPSGEKVGFLIPVDGDPEYLTSRCISMGNIENWNKYIPAKHILYVMDCCYSGLAATRSAGLDPSRNDYIRQVTARPVRQIITAGRGDQKVIEKAGHGVFSSVFIRGILGDADIKGRGFVTGFDLGNYVESRVYEESGWRQQPLFRYLNGDGEFVFLPGTTTGVGPAAEPEAPVRRPEPLSAPVMQAARPAAPAVPPATQAVPRANAAVPPAVPLAASTGAIVAAPFSVAGAPAAGKTVGSLSAHDLQKMKRKGCVVAILLWFGAMFVAMLVYGVLAIIQEMLK